MWKVTLLWGKNGVGSGDQGYGMERSLIFIFGRVIRVAFLRMWRLNKDLKVASYMIKSFWIQKNNRTNRIGVCIPIHMDVCIHTHTHKEICFKDIAHFVFVCCLLLIRFRCDYSVSAGWSQMWSWIFALHPIIWQMLLVYSVTSWCQLRSLE